MKPKRTIITIGGLIPWLTTRYLLNVRTKKIYRVYRRLNNNRLSIELATDKKVIKEQKAIVKRMGK